MSPVDLTDLHVIRYELERDLMPLILSNTQYSIERGQETLLEYDLAKIQQQLVSRFLLGKPLITLNVSKRQQLHEAGLKYPVHRLFCPPSTGDSNASQQV